MSASEKRSLRERLRPKERKPAVRWLLTVLLLAAAVLGLHMLLQMIGTLDFSRGRFSSYLHVPKIYLLNLLPVALLVAFTYFATNAHGLASSSRPCCCSSWTSSTISRSRSAATRSWRRTS